MGDKRAFYLCGTDVVSCDNDDVVRPTEDHDISVLAFYREIPDCVDPLYRLPVLAIPLIILPDRPEHGWPRGFNNKEPPCSGLDRLPVFVNHIRFDTGNRSAGKTRSHRFTDHRGDHVHTGLGLPPSVEDRNFVLANDMIVPLECLRVQWFPD